MGASLPEANSRTPNKKSASPIMGKVLFITNRSLAFAVLFIAF